MIHLALLVASFLFLCAVGLFAIWLLLCLGRGLMSLFRRSLDLVGDLFIVAVNALDGWVRALGGEKGKSRCIVAWVFAVFFGSMIFNWVRHLISAIPFQ